MRASAFAFVIAACGPPAAPPRPAEPEVARVEPPRREEVTEDVSTPDVAKPDDAPLPTYVPPPDAPYRQPPGTTTPAHVEGPTPEDEKECKARGGKIERVCMLGNFECVVRHRDGGKRCTDKSECTGQCIYEGPQPAPARGTGVCQRTSDPCGCKAFVVGGRIQPTICFD